MDRPTIDGSALISSAPERVAEHDDVRSFGEVLGGRENPSDCRAHSQDRKRVRRDAGGCDALRITAAGQIDLPLAPGRHFPQSSGSAPVVHDLPCRHPGLIERRPLAPNHHRATWIGPRQRAEQHGIDHAEDRGVRADPQSQRDYRHRGEARMTREQSGAKTQIVSESVEWHGARLDGRPSAIVAADRRTLEPGS